MFLNFYVSHGCSLQRGFIDAATILYLFCRFRRAIENVDFSAFTKRF